MQEELSRFDDEGQPIRFTTQYPPCKPLRIVRSKDGDTLEIRGDADEPVVRIGPGGDFTSDVSPTDIVPTSDGVEQDAGDEGIGGAVLICVAILIACGAAGGMLLAGLVSEGLGPVFLLVGLLLGVVIDRAWASVFA